MKAHRIKGGKSLGLASFAAGIVLISAIVFVYKSQHGSSEGPRGNSTKVPRVIQRLAHTGSDVQQDPSHRVADATLADDKLEFYRMHNFDPTVTVVLPSKNPLFLFWASRLQSSSKQEAWQAYLMFVEAMQHPLGTLPPDDSSEDVKAINAVASINYFAAKSGQDIFNDSTTYQLGGIDQIKQIVKASMEYLSDPEKAAEAQRVINGFTMDIYGDKDIEWWLKKFHNSKLKAILDGRPRGEWIGLPE